MDPLHVVIVLVVTAVLSIWLAKSIERWFRSRKLNARFSRARAGESQARRLLEQEGFAVIAAQARRDWTIYVDDEAQVVALRADYLVERGAYRYVAEVKTGEAAPRIETSATRRQLLEYSLAFAVDGVLLVDVERQRIQSVRFERGITSIGGTENSARRGLRLLAWLVAMLLLGWCLYVGKDALVH